MNCSCMENNSADKCVKNGFVLMEVFIVLAIMSILSTIAFPYFAQWMKNTEYRSSAREIMNTLREARSMAISKNLEHRVEFESMNRRFRVIQGNRASDSNDWSVVIYDWRTLPPGVHLKSNVDAVHLNTSGTANTGTVCIMDNMLNTKYEIRIARTGRIRIPTIL